jgi:hypothetical protein
MRELLKQIFQSKHTFFELLFSCDLAFTRNKNSKFNNSILFNDGYYREDVLCHEPQASGLIHPNE